MRSSVVFLPVSAGLVSTALVAALIIFVAGCSCQPGYNNACCKGDCNLEADGKTCGSGHSCTVQEGKENGQGFGCSCKQIWDNVGGGMDARVEAGCECGTSNAASA